MFLNLFLIFFIFILPNCFFILFFIILTSFTKNKNLNISVLLQYMFNFQYAGKANIFITYQYNKFVLVHQGIHIIQDIFTFSPNYVASLIILVIIASRIDFDALF